MKTIGAFDAKTHLSQYLTEVETTHESIVIERRGHKIAVLAPYASIEDQLRDERAQAVLSAFQEIRENEAVYGSNSEVKSLVENGRE
jgi:antitoxin YefM